MAHTKGPWEAKVDKRRWTPHYIVAPHAHIADVMPCSLEKKADPEAQANARLIAAAPELLDSLKEFVAAAYAIGLRHDALRNRVERAERAIAKAEGREP